jgi:hypothetical protein
MNSKQMLGHIAHNVLFSRKLLNQWIRVRCVILCGSPLFSYGFPLFRVSRLGVSTLNLLAAGYFSIPVFSAILDSKEAHMGEAYTKITLVTNDQGAPVDMGAFTPTSNRETRQNLWLSPKTAA